jgi:hypothetical protein
LEIEIWDLPFDWTQGGESFDFAQDREPVERLVEPFVIWCLGFEILMLYKTIIGVGYYNFVS